MVRVRKIMLRFNDPSTKITSLFRKVCCKAGYYILPQKGILPQSQPVLGRTGDLETKRCLTFHWFYDQNFNWNIQIAKTEWAMTNNTSAIWCYYSGCQRMSNNDAGLHITSPTQEVFLQQLHISFRATYNLDPFLLSSPALLSASVENSSKYH